MMKVTPDGCTIALNKEQSAVILHCIRQMYLTNCETKRTRQIAHDILQLIHHCTAQSDKIMLKMVVESKKNE